MKKQPRARLTHFEIRRGSRLRLCIAIADDAIGEVGDELGALFVKIAPGAVSTRTVSAAPSAALAVIEAPAPSTGGIEVVEAPPVEIVVAPDHPGDDAEYHTRLRGRLAELMGSLCDASLSDALEIAREERARRADGGN